MNDESIEMEMGMDLMRLEGWIRRWKKWVGMITMHVGKLVDE